MTDGRKKEAVTLCLAKDTDDRRHYISKRCAPRENRAANGGHGQLCVGVCSLLIENSGVIADPFNCVSGYCQLSYYV